VVDGIFIEIGSEPSNLIFKNLGVKTDEKNYIIADREQKTNVKGVFAAGDITNNPLKQIVTSCAEGAIAAFSAYHEVAVEKDRIS
jgi:thioredoxin reductase (NADPH)